MARVILVHPRRPLKIALTLLLLVLTCLFWLPLRNLVIPVGLWADVPTTTLLDYLMWQRNRLPVPKCPAICSKTYVPSEAIAGRNISFYKYSLPKDKLTGPNVINEKVEWKFLPLMTPKEKISILETLDTVMNVLNQIGTPSFLIGGSLLGVIRHRGMIPWDDDVDLAVSSKQWEQTHAALCCIQGFSLAAGDRAHWKLFPDAAQPAITAPTFSFPFLDIFFYDENEEWLWSIAAYGDLYHKKEEVFPLRNAFFDGARYPVPRRADKVIEKVIGDIRQCVSPGNYHRYNHGLGWREVMTVPCSQLQHIYPMTYTLKP